MTNPYVIEPMPLGQKEVKKGECFSFHHILFGSAVEKMSYILLAWSKAGDLGLTRERIKARLIRVSQILPNAEENLLYDFENADAETVSAISDFSIPPAAETSSVRIKILTPMRIQHQGHPIIPNDLTARDFLIALIRRQQLLSKQHIPDYPEMDFNALRPVIETAALTDADVRWFDWKRYSSRQKTQIALGGIMGEFTLTGDFRPIMPYVYAGQWFHVGKSVVMGLGKYIIV